MASGALTRRLVLWVLFVGFCAIGMAYLPNAYVTLPGLGHVTLFDALLVVALVLGAGTLLRAAGSPERSVARTMCRILVAYLLFELLAVVPVAVWLGTATLNEILGNMSVRLTWLVFPVMLMVCPDDRARRLAGASVVIAAACLVAWGVYVAAIGGGGYYVDFGEVRYRILWAGAPLLVAWPFVLVVSGAAPRRYTAALLVVTCVGLVLTNERSGLIAFAVAGLVCLMMSGRIRRVLPAMLPIVLVAAIVGLIWGRQVDRVFGYTLSHLVDVSSGNGADRMMRWRLTWDFFLTHPFNDWVWSWRRYLVDLSRSYQPHNFVLEVATQEGVAGLVFYGSMFWTALSRAWVWGRRDAEARALVGWLVAYVVFSLMNASHYLPTNMPLLVGALAALAARVDQLSQEIEQAADGHVAAEVQA